jgi:hypothetical protein
VKPIRIKILITTAIAVAILSTTPTVATAQSATASDDMSLTDKRFHRRAVESVLWGQPIVDVWAMRNSLRTTFDGGLNDILYFSKPADWKYKFLTVNNTTLYSYTFFNIRDEPIVIEIPKTTKDVGLFGSIMNAWQQAFADFGGQGMDKGLGAKYLIVHKDYQEPIPAGYIPVYQDTYNGWIAGRTLVKDLKPETLVKAEQFIKQMKVYPLSQAGKENKQRFFDGSGKLLNGVAPYDHRFFDALNDMVQEEQVADRDKVAMGMLKDLGIEKGKVYSPNKAAKAKLDKAVKQAQQEMIDMMINNPDRYWPNRKWSYLLVPKVVRETKFSFEYPRMLDYTYRGVTYYSAISSVVNFGTQTQYLVGGQDSNGENLLGENDYVLRIPANVPVKRFWSVLVHDNNTATYVENTPKAGVSSLDQGFITNPDGSVDIYFGPKAPKGKEANWAPTKAGVDYFLLFRFYGPTEAFDQKTWTLGDLRKQ